MALNVLPDIESALQMAQQTLFMQSSDLMYQDIKLGIKSVAQLFFPPVLSKWGKKIHKDEW